MARQVSLGKYILRAPGDAADWAAYHRIRRTALFEPFIPEVVYDPDNPDERKAGNHPLVLIEGDTVIGTIRIDLFDAVRAAFRLVTIDRGYQGRGHGAVLLKMAEDFARAQGRRKVVLHGNPDSVGFYLSSGYVKAPWEDDAAFDNAVDMAKDITDF